MNTNTMITEAIEPCPYCGSENVYPNWDVEKQGYVARCKHCDKEIFLCDECLHADDNRGGSCDWHREDNLGVCFRGITHHNQEDMIE